jgi:hypothetical protein
MSDIETIRAMLTRAGVISDEVAIRGPYREGDAAPEGISPSAWPNDVHSSWLAPGAGWDLGARTVITVEQGEGPRNLGYGGFRASFYFDDAGALVFVGVWE